MRFVDILTALMLCCTLFIHVIPASSQSSDSTAALSALEQANELYFYGDFAKAAVKANIAYGLLSELDSQYFKKQIESNMLLAKCYVFLEKHDSAFFYLTEAEDRLMEQEPIDTLLLTSVYGLRSHAHDRASELKLAMEYGKRSLKWGKKMKPPHPKLGDFYHGLANVYFSLGDYKFSYDLYQQAIDFYRLTKAANDPTVLETRMAKSYAQVQYGEIDEALEEMNSLIKEVAQKTESKTTLMALYAIKASALSKQENYEEALIYIDESLKLIKAMFGENNGFAADVMQAKAQLYFELNEYEKAETLVQKVIGICETSPTNFIDILAAARTDYGNLLSHSDRFEEARLQFDKALSDLNYNNTTKVHEVAYFKELLAVMKVRGGAYLRAYARTKEKDLVMAPVFDEGVELIELVRSIYVHEGSKQKLIEGNYSIFEHALKAKFSVLEDSTDDAVVQSMFDVFEKSKVQTLLDQLRYTEGIVSDKLPKEQAHVIDSLKRIMISSRHELFEMSDKSDSIFRQRSSEYFQHRERFVNYVDFLKNSYPDYYQFVYNQKIISLNDLRASVLNKNTTLVEYFLGESHLYAMYISKREINYTMTPISGNFRSLISSELDAMIHEETDEETQRIIQEAILESLHKNIPQSTERLIIIPDGELMYIPFEILPGKEAKYLIEEYEISYSSSATLLAYQESMSPEAERSFAGFAPSYNQEFAISIDTSADIQLAALVRTGSFGLAAAVDEVMSIANLLDGDLFLEEKATETAFKAQAGKYDILHLAMHALVNSTNPSYSRLLFDLSAEEGDDDDGQLHVEELYGMKLNARLAVLSACNTGFGFIKKGEGSLSISRAFTYAGVPSTLMSLWEVPDKSTAVIMIDFYQQLDKGQTKDAALRQAKLNYLANPSFSGELKKPLYWAGFIATGDMSKMTDNSYYWIYYLGFGLLFGALLMWWLKSRQKS